MERAGNRMHCGLRLAIVGLGAAFLACSSAADDPQPEKTGSASQAFYYGYGHAYSQYVPIGPDGSPDFQTFEYGGGGYGGPWYTAGPGTLNGAYGLGAVSRSAHPQEIFYISANGDLLHLYTDSCSAGLCWGSYGSDDWGQPRRAWYQPFGQVGAATDHVSSGVDVFELAACLPGSWCNGLYLIFTRHWDAVHGLGPWTIIDELGADDNGFYAFDGVSVASSGTNSFDVFRVMPTATKEVRHTWTTDRTHWSTEFWTSPFGPKDYLVAAASFSANRVEIFYQDFSTPTHLQHGYQVNHGSPVWDDWGATPCTSPYGAGVQAIGATAYPGGVLVGVECEIGDPNNYYHFELQLIGWSGGLGPWFDAGRLPSTTGDPPNRMALTWY